MSSYHVTKVEPIAHLTLRVAFADALQGEVPFEMSHLYGVFELLKDPAVFAKARCCDGLVEWPGNLALAPDAMYEALKAHGCWVLT